jgi:hypothetical protein
MHFRSITSNKIDIAELIESVLKGTYDDLYVQELLNINDFTYFVAARPYSNMSAINYMEVRKSFLALKENAVKRATKNGQINERQSKDNFDSHLYSEIKEILPISLYEAGQANVWEYLTARVLLDVAVWRFGTENVSDRFIGLNRSRHVFARWWFRRSIAEEAEVEPNYELLETEWETVFERPGLCWNPAIANACLRVLQETKDNVPSNYKSKYSEPPKRIWIKRIMRLTSQSNLDAFDEDDLHVKFSNLHPYNED